MVTKTIELEAKTDKAIQELEDLRKEVKKLNEQVEIGNEATSTGITAVGKATKKTNNLLVSLGNTLKAIGIGLLLSTLDKLQEAFNQNQKVVDFFNTTFETLGLLFSDFVDFVDENTPQLVDNFKKIFESPIESMVRFGESLSSNIVERFRSLAKTLQFVGQAVAKFVTGDFKSASDFAKKAQIELADVITGVNNSAEKLGMAIAKSVTGVTKYAKETIKGAKANVELQKSAEVARVVLQGLVEQYDRQAEKLRQTRDEERNTIEDRIKANNDLKSVLDEQEKAMLKQVDLQIASAQAQYDKNGNQENYIDLLEATQEREAVLAQIEGFRSEQKMNDLALSRELIELEETQAEGKIERRISEQEFLAEQIEGEYLRLEALQTVALEEARLEEERLTKKRDLYQEGTQAYVDANEELLNFQSENNQKQLELDKKLQESKATLITGALNNIASIVGKNSKFGKAIAIVQAIRDTYAGANKALSSAPPPFNFISAAATVAAGIANVRQIARTQEPQAPAGVSTGGATSIPASTPPAFNVIGATGTNQLAEAIAGQNQQPLRAYVVSNEVTSAQSLDRNIVSEATL
tara:strand:- start:584 stop:2329 length:1746 start_codon:yes stop_codon:yes gene_type:complete